MTDKADYSPVTSSLFQYRECAMAPKEEWQEIETRIISGRGLFQYNLNEADRDICLQLVAIRSPIRDYPNKNYPREPSIYAYVEWEYQGAIQRTDVLRYKFQDFYWVQDPSGQLYFSLTCIYEALQARLTAIGSVLGIPPPAPGDPIWTIPTQRYFDKILIECFNDTALEARLLRLRYDRSCPEAEPDRREPDRPQPPPIIPPGDKLGEGGAPPVSPPYDGGNDGGDTVPFPGDSDEPPSEYPKGEDCERWIVAVSWSVDGGAEPPSGIFTIGVFAPIRSEPVTSVVSAGGFTDLLVSIESRGFSFLPACGEPTTVEVRAAQAAGEGRQYTVSSVTVSPEV